jgi:4-hydroxy-tetrahydrodipicolinate synthase
MAKASKRIVAVKESTGSMDLASEIRIACGPDFGILSGDDSLTLPLMALGASGVISVAANLVPKEVSLLCDMCLEERFDEAEAIHRKLYPLIKALFIETNPSPVKAAMKEAGLISDESLRLPMIGIRADSRAKLKAAMKTFGVKK